MRRSRGAIFMRKSLCLFLVAAALSGEAPLSAGPKGDEPIAVPRTIRQGIDFVYVDPQMSTVAKRRQRPQNWLARLFSSDSGRRQSPNPVFFELQRGLQ